MTKKATELNTDNRYEAGTPEERLAEYEQTGLSPAQIENLKSEVKQWRSWYQECIDEFLQMYYGISR